MVGGGFVAFPHWQQASGLFAYILRPNEMIMAPLSATLTMFAVVSSEVGLPHMCSLSHTSLNGLPRPQPKLRHMTSRWAAS